MGFFHSFVLCLSQSLLIPFTPSFVINWCWVASLPVSTGCVVHQSAAPEIRDEGLMIEEPMEDPSLKKGWGVFKKP